MGYRMKIKDIKQPKEGYFRIKWKDLEANIFEDGRQFCATSFDEEWSCVGIIINYSKNLENDNPLLQINNIYKDNNIK